MQVVQQILVLVHLIGFAALLGGVLVQLRDPEPEVSAAMLWGAWIELFSGGALFVLAELDPGFDPTVRLVSKAVLTLCVVVLVSVNRKYAFIPRGLWGLIGGLTLVMAGISVIGSAL